MDKSRQVFARQIEATKVVLPLCNRPREAAMVLVAKIANILASFPKDSSEAYLGALNSCNVPYDAINEILEGDLVVLAAFLHHGIICRFWPDRLRVLRYYLLLPETWYPYAAVHRCAKCFDSVFLGYGLEDDWSALMQTMPPARRLWSFYRYLSTLPLPAYARNMQFMTALRVKAFAPAPHRALALCVASMAIDDGYIDIIQPQTDRLRAACHFWHIMVHINEDVRKIVAAFVNGGQKMNGPNIADETRDTFYSVFYELAKMELRA